MSSLFPIFSLSLLSASSPSFVLSLLYFFFFCSLLLIGKMHGGEGSFGVMVVVYVGDGCGSIFLCRWWCLMVVVDGSVDGGSRRLHDHDKFGF